MTIVSIFAVGYTRLGTKILKMAPPSIKNFDLEDTGKLVTIIAVSEMTREYLSHQTENPTRTHARLNGALKMASIAMLVGRQCSRFQ